MTYTGRVHNGVVIFDGEQKPADGTLVRIVVIASDNVPSKKIDDGRSIWEVLRELAGTVEGLPSDMADNHDHYIHGTPKRPPS